MMPRSLRMSPSWTSFSLSQSSSANSVRSEAEESLPRATTSNATSWRSLSRRPSRSRRTPESSSKCKRQAQKADPTNDMSISTRARTVSSAEVAGHTQPRSIWSTDDSYLPRAKPPPPLKLIKHKRDRSEHNKPPPDPTTPGPPSISSNKSSPQSSQSHLAASHSFPSSLDVPILDMSSENPDGLVVQHGLTRSSTPLTIASEASDDASLSFAPIESRSSWKWKPPTSWAGPSNAVSADEDDGSKPVGGWRFTTCRKKSDESTGSSQDSSLQTPTSLYRARSHNELRPVRFADVGEPEGHVFGTGSGALSPGLAVKIQCYENHEWQEKPVADVIPMLRELKIK